MGSHTDHGGVPSRTADMLLLRTSQDTTWFAFICEERPCTTYTSSCRSERSLFATAEFDHGRGKLSVVRDGVVAGWSIDVDIEVIYYARLLSTDCLRLIQEISPHYTKGCYCIRYAPTSRKDYSSKTSIVGKHLRFLEQRLLHTVNIIEGA